MADARVLPSSRRDWLALLRELELRPNKGLGQNFLFERGIVQRMVRVAGVRPDDLVVEVGPGLGILTEELLLRGARVLAIELDRRLAAHLRVAFGSHPAFQLVEADALRIDLAELIPAGESYAVVANLPYAVGAAVLRHLLEQDHRPRQLTVMLQKEVAARLIAQPPAMTILGVATQFYTEPRLGFAVPPEVFIPPPKVESAVVVLTVRPEPPLAGTDRARFFRIVNAGFRQKRKQVANSLAAELELPKAAVTDWLGSVGIDPMRRAQTFTVEEWVALTRSAPADVTA